MRLRERSSGLTSVTDWQSKVTSYTYDNANRLTSTTLGNGLIADRTYDNADRLLTLTNRNGGTTISSYAYTLDAIGNRTQRVDSLGTESYTYDSLYRLTGVTYGNSDTQSYTFDSQGNRLTKVHNGTTTTSTYDDADQLATAGGVTYTHDNAGNQTAAGSDTFTWNAEDRLTATNIGGTSGSYAYNGDGLRTSRTIGGSTVGYIWDQRSGLPNVLQDSAGNRYVYGHDLISIEASGGALTYFLYDGLGSVTGLCDGSGTVIGSYTYDVYGATRSQTGATTEWNYTGEQNDPTGLQFLRARYYDKAAGRFVSEDPLPLTQRYAYVGGNPVLLVDPYGLFGCCRLPKPTIPDIVDWTEARLSGAYDGVIQPVVDATEAAAHLLANSYYDLNVTAGCYGFVLTGGVMVDKNGGYGYGGSGFGGCGASVSLQIAPYQSVSEGWNCGASVAAPLSPIGVGVSSQVGRGGSSDPSRLLSGKEGTAFGEVGVSWGVGVAAACYYVQRMMAW